MNWLSESASCETGTTPCRGGTGISSGTTARRSTITNRPTATILKTFISLRSDLGQEVDGSFYCLLPLVSGRNCCWIVPRLAAVTAKLPVVPSLDDDEASCVR